ncbi:hypothetical protein [Janibacter terrae]|uniref:hypothetical protein n=1 Tax=Janibacter terrae TaxID=103817 RepID=UPI0037F86D91
MAYRRRFLLEKYPHLADGDTFGAGLADEDAAKDADQVISVTRQLAEAGGPDLT